MRTLRSKRLGIPWVAMLALALFGLHARPVGAVPASAAEVLDEVNAHLRDAEYDEAIQRSQRALEELQGDAEALRAVYLLLAKTFVTRANSVLDEPQGRTTSTLYYKEARSVVVECLSIPELRNTRPDPPTDYPERLVRIFSEERARMFGSFRVVGLNPPEATVYFDDRPFPSGRPDLPSETDIPIGEHTVVVEAEGYDTLTEIVEISPASTLERAYALEGKKGVKWYAVRGLAAVAAVVGISLATSGGGDSPSPDPLPEPPPPPPGG